MQKPVLLSRPETAMNRRISRHPALRALTMALGQRQVEGELIHHSDRGKSNRPEGEETRKDKGRL